MMVTKFFLSITDNKESYEEVEDYNTGQALILTLN